MSYPGWLMIHVEDGPIETIPVSEITLLLSTWHNDDKEQCVLSLRDGSENVVDATQDTVVRAIRSAAKNVDVVVIKDREARFLMPTTMKS